MDLASIVFALAIVATARADEPACAAIPPGSTYAAEPPSYFPTEFLEVPVLSVRHETHNSKVVTFALPEGVSLELPISSAIVMNAPGAGPEGKDVARPYNPISSNEVRGSFELLIKVYDDGHASAFAGRLKPGDMVGFKQVKPNVKGWRYPFGKESITMLAGGTGIAPMIQALYPLLKTAGDTTKVRLLYGNLTPEDIMLKAELDQLAEDHSDRFELTYIVGREDFDDTAIDSYGWGGEVGWIDEEKIGRLAFPPSPRTAVWVCGVDDMYTSLAGSRMKPLAPGSALHNLGYTEEMVWRS